MLVSESNSLKSLCLQYICRHYDDVFEHLHENDNPTGVLLGYKLQNDCRLPTDLSEMLFQAMAEANVINDQTAMLFERSQTSLRQIKLTKGDILTMDGVRRLFTHNFEHIACVNWNCMSVNQLLACLSAWSRANLLSLNVSKCNFNSWPKHACAISYSALLDLGNLRRLNLSHTQFTDHGLELVCSSLTHLTHLNLSDTRVIDLTPLVNLAASLQVLILFNVWLDTEPEKNARALKQLHELRHLDVSYIYTLYRPMVDNTTPAMVSLLDDPTALPNLVYFDLASHNEYNLEAINAFVDAHPHLRVLGLYNSNVCLVERYWDTSCVEYNADLKVLGYNGRRQLLNAIRAYVDRECFLVPLLASLLRVSWQWTRVDLLTPVFDGDYENAVGYFEYGDMAEMEGFMGTLKHIEANYERFQVRQLTAKLIEQITSGTPRNQSNST